MAETLENLNDESLMERVQQHDHQAFSILVERHTGRFYGAAYRYVMNQDDAEDIVQDCFLKIWNKPTLWKKGKGAKFTTWFYRIVTNLSLDYLRRLKKQGSTIMDDDIQSNEVMADQKITNDERESVLNQSIQALPEKQMMALNMVYYEDISRKEAAKILKVSVKALESLLSRAKENLRNSIKRTGILEEERAA